MGHHPLVQAHRRSLTNRQKTNCGTEASPHTQRSADRPVAGPPSGGTDFLAAQQHAAVDCPEFH
jgi:hypothetical protein